MDLKKQLEDALYDAMRTNQDLEKNTIRMVLSSIKFSEIDKQTSLNEQEIISIIQKEIKIRHETIDEVKSADRSDLVDKAKNEISILTRYLPAQLTDDELDLLVKKVIISTNASSIKEMGIVMKSVLPAVVGRASSERISNAVKKLLA